MMSTIHLSNNIILNKILFYLGIFYKYCGINKYSGFWNDICDPFSVSGIMQSEFVAKLISFAFIFLQIIEFRSKAH